MTHETAQTREALVEVMARSVSQYPDRLLGDKPTWEHWKQDAADMLAALEAAGVRLVPSEASAEMIAMAQMLYTVDELTSEEYRAAYRVMTAYSPYAKDKP